MNHPREPWDDLRKAMTGLTPNQLARVQGYVDRIWEEEKRKSHADIASRLDCARYALDDGECDPIVYESCGAICHVSDVLHDAAVAIRRLRGELPSKDSDLPAVSTSAQHSS